MNKMSVFFGRLCHSTISFFLTGMLAVSVTLGWISPAFCQGIHAASFGCNLAKVQALLRADPNLVNSTDMVGATPLHSAAANNCRDVVELLLANGADVNAKDRFGCTPLKQAEINGKHSVAELLRQHGGVSIGPNDNTIIRRFQNGVPLQDP
jgi:ankyrin repeat protein